MEFPGLYFFHFIRRGPTDQIAGSLCSSPVRSPDGKSEKGLADAFSFDSAKAFKEWERSDLVKPHWDEFHNDYLSPEWKKALAEGAGEDEAKAVALPGAKGLINVQKALANIQKYNRTNVNKADWLQYDHQARLIHKMKIENTTNKDGIFYQKAMSENDRDFMIKNISSLGSRKHGG